MKKILEDIYNNTEKWDEIYLVKLFDEIRPKRAKDHFGAIEKIKELIEILKDEPDLKEGLNNYLTEMFMIKDPIHLYMESGIILIAGFISEGFRKIKEHILAPVFPEKDLRTILNSVFYKKSDFKWIKNIPDELFVELIRYMGIFCHFPRQKSENKHFNNFVSAIQILSHKIAAMGMAPEITGKLTHLDEINSPFLEQNKELTFYLNKFDENTSVDNDDYKQIQVILDQCTDSLHLLRKKKANFGTSTRLTNIVRRLMQLITRLRILLLLIHQNDQNIFRQNAVLLFKELVEAETTKNSLKKHLRHNLELVNYQVVEHSATIAKHYIAENRKEFKLFFLSSLGGGILVAVAGLIKLMSYGSGDSPFGSAMLTSLIYCVCFVSIQLTGSTLATKVPSVTASSIASVIDRDRHLHKEKDVVIHLKDLIIRITRSQFIFFMGNLLGAFTVGYFITWMMINVVGINPGTPEKYKRLIDELHLWESPSLFFAMLAGMFLFHSSLITGFYENMIIYDRIPDRIRSSRWLKKLFSEGQLISISSYIGRNTGKLFGNISLGLFFGFTPVIGSFFGLYLDTRHIAFTTANFGISLSATGSGIAINSIIHTVISISIIGFLNFIVSFGLALGLAIRSRNLKLKETDQLLKIIFIHLVKRPKDYFYPPKK